MNSLDFEWDFIQDIFAAQGQVLGHRDLLIKLIEPGRIEIWFESIYVLNELFLGFCVQRILVTGLRADCHGGHAHGVFRPFLKVHAELQILTSRANTASHRQIVSRFIWPWSKVWRIDRVEYQQM